MLFKHLARLFRSIVWQAASTRRIGLLLVVVLAVVVLSIALASQAAAPFVLYPFA